MTIKVTVRYIVDVPGGRIEYSWPKGAVHQPELLVERDGQLWIKSPFADVWKRITPTPCGFYSLASRRD